MPLTPLYTCARCKKEFNFGNIKYDDDKKLVCLECLQQENLLRKKNTASLEGKPQPKEPINFICMSCRFKFKIKKGSQQSIKCPYCGKTRLMLVKRYKDEDDLIEESMDPRFNH